jgi:uncharacterized membrane protein
MLSRKILIATGLFGIAQSIYFYTKLPDRVAIHFGSNGVPDGWASNLTNLVLAVTLYLSMVVLFMVIPLIVRKVPARFISLPNREHWLSDERVDSTIGKLSHYLNIFGIAIIIFFLILGYYVYIANMSNPIALNEMAIWLIAGGFLVFTIVWLILFYKKFNHI